MNTGTIGTELKTNILIVCMTDETIEEENIAYIKQLLRMTTQGGFLIVNYTETDEQGLEENIDSALTLIESVINLYPSKIVPII